ncbi:hypothetical protein os1_41410 [Comamonadaceae bacterium OS-1]|nr:hypothetical protein os1_41410 [Comamonadaceae bacterium OS-1]
MTLQNPNQNASQPFPATPQNGEATMALLKVLALGSREREQGQFRDAEAVFARLEQ